MGQWLNFNAVVSPFYTTKQTVPIHQTNSFFFYIMKLIFSLIHTADNRCLFRRTKHFHWMSEWMAKHWTNERYENKEPYQWNADQSNIISNLKLERWRSLSFFLFNGFGNIFEWRFGLYSQSQKGLISTFTSSILWKLALFNTNHSTWKLFGRNFIGLC